MDVDAAKSLDIMNGARCQRIRHFACRPTRVGTTEAADADSTDFTEFTPTRVGTTEAADTDATELTPTRVGTMQRTKADKRMEDDPKGLTGCWWRADLLGGRGRGAARQVAGGLPGADRRADGHRGERQRGCAGARDVPPSPAGGGAGGGRRGAAAAQPAAGDAERAGKRMAAADEDVGGERGGGAGGRPRKSRL
jgi:hypothetical protein